jgi:hypothetical protein
LSRSGDITAIVIASEAKQSKKKEWIASSLTLLAMTVFGPCGRPAAALF